MAGTHVWPVDAVAGAPVFTGRQGRQLAVAPFVAGATAARPLGARSGVRPGTPATTVTATSTTWTVGEHAGVIDAELAAEAGPYTYSFDAVQTGTMTAADPSNPRTDLISVQISDPAESDGSSTPSVGVVYTVGTPGATPAVPAAPARSMVLAQINVPVAGGGSPSVIWVAPYLTGPGGIVPNPSTAQQTLLNAAASASNPIWIDDGGVLKRSVGSGFVPAAAPAISAAYSAAPTFGAAVPAGTVLTMVTNTVNATTSGGGAVSFTFPVAFPTALVSVVIQPLNNFTQAPINGRAAVTKTGVTFIAYSATGAAITSGTSIDFFYLAIGY